MSRPVSHTTVISAIVRKDLAEYGRDRLWAFLTVLVLVIVAVLYRVLPDSVEESIAVAVVGLDGIEEVEGLAGTDEGLDVVVLDTSEDLRSVVAGEATAWRVGDGVVLLDPSADGPEGAEQADIAIGIAFPDDFLRDVASGGQTEVTVFLDAAVPEEVRGAMTSMVREIAHVVAGEELPIDMSATEQSFVVLGPDRAGDQVSAREGFRPILVFLVLMMEMFVMASLIAKEIQDRTVTAVLVTPASVGDVLAAKGITGAISGLGQAVIVLLAINSLRPHPGLILLLLLLGSVMISGTAMLAGSTGRDFISTLFYGMAYMIPLLVPAFAALFPGTASAWIQALPSYPLVRGLVDVTNNGAGWAETLPELGALTAWCVVLFGLGWVVLRRKVESL